MQHKLLVFLGVICFAILDGALKLPLVAQSGGAKGPVVPEDLAPKVQTKLPGVRLTLLAEHPSLVTPTGIDVDDQGRIWVAVCHTHFRPDDYPGPAKDEIVVFDSQGKNRELFYQNTEATMHVECGKDGWIYLAERDRILRVKDTDGDGRGDLEEELASLDTVADYPHNGLSGMAWHPNGGLVFSLGENFGKDWVLTARDGGTLRGRGEGGVFYCTADGSKLRRIAKGFWNPFGLLVLDDGEIFAAENDPGSRPPCRLLHVVEGADYGFQWVYGSAPIHPFVAWNGELRGTLGMIHPCGEGPCAVVQLGGGLLIPSWSEHCIDYYPLSREGATYKSSRIELLRGSDNFRPVCMTVGPDSAFYFTDWVYSSYQLHQRGRLWKLEIDPSEASSWMIHAIPAPNDSSKLAQSLRTGELQPTRQELMTWILGKDPYLADAALSALARLLKSQSPDDLKKLDGNERLWGLVALRRVDLSDTRWIRPLLDDPNQDIRFEVLRWIADGVLTEFQPYVEKQLSLPSNDFALFEASLAAWNTLRGEPTAGVTDPDVLLTRLTNPEVPLKLKGYALRLLQPTHPKLTAEILQQLLQSGDEELQLEVIRTLAQRLSKESIAQASRKSLNVLLSSKNLASKLRLEAIASLARSNVADDQDILLEIAESESNDERQTALRALRSYQLKVESRGRLDRLLSRAPESQIAIKTLLDPQALSRAKPPVQETKQWLKAIDELSGEANASQGRSTFYYSTFAACSNCHRHEGRGNVVGPDLSLIAKQGDRESILRSILEPHRDVAPQFYTTLLELDDGTTFTGILLRSSSTEVFRDAQGEERTFQKEEIVKRKELKSSMMPEAIVNQLTMEELRDLLAFLSQGASH